MAVLLLATLCSCGKNLKKGPATILPRLENAYNTQDLYGIVECFDPSVTSAFFGVASLFGADGDALQAIMPFASKVLGTSGALDNEAWGTVSLTATDYEIDGDTATLSYKVELRMKDGTGRTFDETINTIKVDDVWYISLVN